MRDFYHPTLAAYGPENVPHILGLTASPTISSNRELSLVWFHLSSMFSDGLQRY